MIKRLLTKNENYIARRKEYHRKYKEIHEVKQINIGRSCENCNQITNDQEAHHIIPLNASGTNEISNIKRFCADCHRNLHGTLSQEEQAEKVQYTYEKQELRPNHPSCNNCKSSDDLKTVYVIPGSIGGRAVRENTATLCSSCRTELYKITDKKTGRISHNILTSQGMKRAQEAGIITGRPSKKKEALLSYFYFILNPTESIKDITEKAGISITAYNKYKKKYDEKYSHILNGDNITFILNENGELYRTISKNRLNLTYIHTVNIRQMKQEEQKGL